MMVVVENANFSYSPSI